MLFGAVAGGYAGLHMEFAPQLRPDAVKYAEGYALSEAGLCAGRFPIRVSPKPCHTFDGIDRVAIDPAQPIHVRALAYSFFTGTRKVAFRWIPAGAATFAVLLWIALGWRNRKAWDDRPRASHRNFFPDQ
jgi:hypothetical protein